MPTAPPVKYEPPAYADPAKFEETEVTVGSGEWALPGTLTMPKGAGPFPGLVLVHGSGPNDRDETLGPNKPFKDLAWGLATRGIAVLRYDKRSKVHGKKILADPKLEATMTVKDETIDDALAAAALLQKAKGVDPKRVFILGHSLGGFLMPRIALAAEPLQIAGFHQHGRTDAAARRYDRPPDDLSLRPGRDQRFRTTTRRSSRTSRHRWRRSRRSPTPIGARPSSSSGPCRRIGSTSAATIRPRWPRRSASPCCSFRASRDYQVQTADLENWKKALGSRNDVEFHLYPKLNHLFYEGEGILIPLEYMQKHGSVAPYVIDDIA